MTAAAADRRVTIFERLRAYKTLEDWKKKRSEQIRASGYVLHTLEAALWAFFKYDDWTSGALDLVNLGECFLLLE